MFEPTALIVRGPVTSGERFVINLDRVMICEDEVRVALLCRISREVRTLPRETSSLILASLRLLSLRQVVTASPIVLCLSPGATWRLHIVRKRWLKFLRV